MKAPDKIYLNSKHPEPYWFAKQQVDSDIEYIRKDFLLHILAKKKEEVGIGLSEYDMGKENGKYQVLNELIEEIKVL